MAYDEQYASHVTWGCLVDGRLILLFYQPFYYKPSLPLFPIISYFQHAPLNITTSTSQYNNKHDSTTMHYKQVLVIFALAQVAIAAPARGRPSRPSPGRGGAPGRGGPPGLDRKPSTLKDFFIGTRPPPRPSRPPPAKKPTPPPRVPNPPLDRQPSTLDDFFIGPKPPSKTDDAEKQRTKGIVAKP